MEEVAYTSIAVLSILVFTASMCEILLWAHPTPAYIVTIGGLIYWGYNKASRDTRRPR